MIVKIFKKKKQFILKSSTNFKEKISIGKEMVIYLIEKDDIQYPLYAFKFYYTNIALNPLFSNIIYTDAEYLLFDMSCEINQIKNK